MSNGGTLNDHHRSRRSLYLSLCQATALVESIRSMYSSENQIMKATFLGHTFSASSAGSVVGDVSSKSIMSIFGSWLRAHEEAQVMVGSILVVLGVWWLVRTLLALVINLLCPLVLVLLAVVCVPQLRQPLLGQNYPAVSNILRTILLKMAENLKTNE